MPTLPLLIVTTSQFINNRCLCNELLISWDKPINGQLQINFVKLHQFKINENISNKRANRLKFVFKFELFIKKTLRNLKSLHSLKYKHLREFKFINNFLNAIKNALISNTYAGIIY